MKRKNHGNAEMVGGGWVGGCPNQRRQATMIIFFPVFVRLYYVIVFSSFSLSLDVFFCCSMCVFVCVCARSVVPAFHTFSQQATLLPLITGSCVSLCVCAAKFSLLLSAAPHTAQHSHKMFVWLGWWYSPALSLSFMATIFPLLTPCFARLL